MHTDGPAIRGDLRQGVERSRPIAYLVSLAERGDAVDEQENARLLPLAAERGVAVIVNRPFAEGALIEELARHPLPPWAREIDCASWPQLLLKFAVSHPAVTCAIPATSQPAHLDENMAAARGRMPDEAFRRRIVDYVEGL